MPPIPGTGGASTCEGSRTAAPTRISPAAVEGSTCHCDPSVFEQFVAGFGTQAADQRRIATSAGLIRRPHRGPQTPPAGIPAQCRNWVPDRI